MSRIDKWDELALRSASRECQTHVGVRWLQAGQFLDGRMECCDSGYMDFCGICNGDGTACGMRVLLHFLLDPSADVPAPTNAAIAQSVTELALEVVQSEYTKDTLLVAVLPVAGDMADVTVRSPCSVAVPPLLSGCAPSAQWMRPLCSVAVLPAAGDMADVTAPSLYLCLCPHASQLVSSHARLQTQPLDEQDQYTFTGCQTDTGTRQQVGITLKSDLTPAAPPLRDAAAANATAPPTPTPNDPYGDAPPRDRFMAALHDVLGPYSAWTPPRGLALQHISNEPLCGDSICTFEEVHGEEHSPEYGTTCPLDCHIYGRCTLAEVDPLRNFTAAAMDFTRAQAMFGVRRTPGMPAVRPLPLLAPPSALCQRGHVAPTRALPRSLFQYCISFSVWQARSRGWSWTSCWRLPYIDSAL